MIREIEHTFLLLYYKSGGEATRFWKIVVVHFVYCNVAGSEKNRMKMRPAGLTDLTFIFRKECL
jgi:hypothetical protein